MSRWWGREFSFTTSFSLGTPRERVAALLVDLEHYSAWWPQVRAVGKLDDDHALVVCRSTLPYDLELVLTARSREPEHLEVGLDGPISGYARFRLTEDATARTSVLFEQEVRAVASSFVVASYVVKPLLVWNHERMMRGLVDGVRDRLQPSAASAAS